MNNLVDPDDFCRKCKGTGQATVAPEEAPMRCYLCEGTGLRTVRVLPARTEDDK